jgi:hypothetical protein
MIVNLTIELGQFLYVTDSIARKTVLSKL